MYSPSTLEYVLFYGGLAVLFIAPLRRGLVNILPRMLGLNWRLLSPEEKPHVEVTANPCPEDPNYFILSWNTPGSGTFLDICRSYRFSRTVSTSTVERLPDKGSMRLPMEATDSLTVHYSIVSTYRGNTMGGSYWMRESRHFEKLVSNRRWNRVWSWGIVIGILACLWLIRVMWPASIASSIATRGFVFVAGLAAIMWLHWKIERKSKVMAHLVSWPLLLILFIGSFAVQIAQQPSEPERASKAPAGRQSKMAAPPSKRPNR